MKFYHYEKCGGKSAKRYIDSGAEISVMPETLYKKLYVDIHSTGRTLFATGENPLHMLGCVCMELSRGDTTIQEDVYSASCQNATTRTTRDRKVGTDT